ncbi:MAG: glycosyltransferase, partial [Planctomycetes bacterium]|nr:glycosyltransferase [Planctomycetota bacterium]
MERSMVALLNALDRGDALHLVVTLREAGALAAELRDDVACYAMRAKGRSWLTGPKLARVARTFGATVIHARGVGCWADALVARLLNPQVRLVLGFHGFEAGRRFSTWHRCIARCALAADATFASVSSAGVRQLIEQLGVPGERIRLLANGVRLDTPAGTVVGLRALGEAGYRVVDAPEDGAELIARLAAGPTNALSARERADAQTTFPEYSDPNTVAAANKRDRQSNDLPRLPDPVFWSGYQPVQNGHRINVPGERPFFQFQVEFTSTDPTSATSISNLRIEQLFPPILQAVVAEIVPAAEIAAGRDTLFTYALRPFFRAGDPGFNRIRIPTPTAVSEVLSVEFAYGRETIERSEAVAFE